METFTRLFSSLLLFIYHCFDRVVINGYLSGLSRPGQVVHFFHNVVGEPVKELVREKVGFRKNDNAFLSVSDPQALQAAADRFTSEVIRKQLDYWTLIQGPKFSKRERAAMNLRRFYAISQIEYCRNFILKRNFPIHKIFERGCEIGLWRMTANKIAEVFGQRVTKKLKGKLNTAVEQIEHGHHIFRAYCRNVFIKQYEKFSAYLRNEACSTTWLISD